MALIVPTLHPAFLLRSGEDKGSGQAKFAHVVSGDIAKAKRLVRERPRWDESQIHQTDSIGRPWRLFPNADEVELFCRVALENARRGGTLVVDVETSGDHPMMSKLLCVGMGLVDSGGVVRELLCVPFLARYGLEYWAPNDRARVQALLAFILAQCPTCFHNGAFDTLVLACHGMPVGRWCSDTMQAGHVADGEMPAGLYYAASRKTDGRYWKDDVKGDVGWLDMHPTTLRGYNLRDVLSTGICLPALEADVRAIGPKAWRLYQQEIALCRYFTRATARGIAVDEERRLVLATKLRGQRDQALATLRALAGHGGGFDPAKPTHLRHFLYEYLRFPVVKTSQKSGLPSTDKDAMVLLALYAQTPQQIAALKALVDYRVAEKSLSTWVENLGILPDGRIHSSFKLLPVTGRFATSPNIQNLPVAIKKILCAARPGTADRRGWKFVGVDLSQAELRQIGYDANDPVILEMYARGVNIHTVNCALFFGVRAPEGHEDEDPTTWAYMQEVVPKLVGKDPATFPRTTKATWKPTRTLSKNGEFGSNYGGEDESLFKVLRSKRDPDTNELLFPDIELSEVSAILEVKRKIRPALMRWQQDVTYNAQKIGKTECPISGRVRWYRGGFKLTEVTATRIQTAVASHMNERTLEIVETLDRETSGAAQIVDQVHDALFVEAPDEYTKRAGQVMVDVLGRPFEYPGFPEARLPSGKPNVGQYLNEV